MFVSGAGGGGRSQWASRSGHTKRSGKTQQLNDLLSPVCICSAATCDVLCRCNLFYCLKIKQQTLFHYFFIVICCYIKWLAQFTWGRMRMYKFKRIMLRWGNIPVIPYDTTRWCCRAANGSTAPRQRTSWLFAWLALRNICYIRKLTVKCSLCFLFIFNIFSKTRRICNGMIVGNVLYSFVVIFISPKMNLKNMKHKQLEYFNIYNIKLHVFFFFFWHFISDNYCFLY